MAVASRRIVERFNVIRNVGNGNFPILVDSLFDALFLQTTEESFCDRVVPAISPPAHTWFETLRFAEASPIVTSILQALVRVNESLLGMSATHGHHDLSLIHISEPT